ncbi:hypothetical protein GOP47_0000580 [Adiantum capillus-veneris]|uniref:Uncharacterized protein n=1 Tax=Adiantum capillus-veneris TaxID=13818 RepID=A0A9D4VF05_ADICA|nr:hypothetical protein GOP47_0000580 [Adiantum capillus-veneris]
MRIQSLDAIQNWVNNYIRSLLSDPYRTSYLLCKQSQLGVGPSYKNANRLHDRRFLFAQSHDQAYNPSEVHSISNRGLSIHYPSAVVMRDA